MNNKTYEQPHLSLLILSDCKVLTESPDDYASDIWDELDPNA